jgi:diacylglycerol O-acyltransferase / wax synthase
MSNVLDLADQTLFLGERATETTSVLQCIWVYDHAFDIDGLRKFHHHLGRGRLSRRIERSPLPFGRHRWVSASDRPSLEIASTPRPRAEIDAWLDGQASNRPDAEHGPGWHLAALPLTDGGAVVSFVVTHCLTDGLGLCEALADAACGHDDAIAWPAAASRRRWQALREDARQTARDTADVGRAVVAAARLARRSRAGAESTAAASKKRPAPPTGPDQHISLPMAMLFFDADEWDARAQSLGGTSNALLAGLAAHLAQCVGRVAADGSVNVGMPLNERAPGDTRANAVINVDVTVKPAGATKDLREIRAAIKESLIRHQDLPDERWTLLPLIPLIPKGVFRRLISVITGSATTVVSSNLGAINPAANRPDGTDADYFAMKSVYPGVTNTTMYRTNGALALLSGRVGQQVFVSVLAYELGRHNSNDDLRQHVSSALSEFSLTAKTGWRTNVSGLATAPGS